MSAIAGIIHFNKEPIIIEETRNMMIALEKFPADDIRVWNNEHVFFGCHAQWITLESIGEPLPFYDSERQCTITADCIIDNRDELFEQLQISKEKRRSMPDSQLILLAYYKWGEEAPKYLVGDFAFMIWDEREQKLFGARDFSGSRTLYYYRDQNRIVFCTVMMPLFTLPYIKKELNEEWLAEFLAIIGMIDVVDACSTAHKNIFQVPPSHSITVTSDKAVLKQYCHIITGKKIKLKSNEEYVEAFQDVFQEAVNARLRTHRQVGAQLSGGLDSGSIVSFAAGKLESENKKLHTFSYIPPKDFEDFTPWFLMPDERPLIKSTVEHVGNIKDYYLDFENRDSFTEIDDFLGMMEMPYKFFENSFWLKGIFEEAQKKDVGLLLNGGRGNLSISWGSAIDYYAILLKKLKWVKLFNELNDYSKNVGGNRLRRLPIIAKAAFPFLEQLVPADNPYTFPNLINREFAKKTSVFKRLKEHGMDESGWFSSANIFEQRKSHFEEVFHWNASNTLAAKLSMQHSLWKRDPSNDIRVIQYCLSLPEEQYVQKGVDRSLIRRATKNLLPDEIRLNQRVRGVQGADWVHRMIPHWNVFIDELHQLSNDPLILQYIDGQVIQHALKMASKEVSAKHATDPNYKILMRTLIVYRFIKNIA